MQYQPSRDQRALVASIDDALQAILPIARWHDRQSESAADWNQLAELGLFDLAAVEDAGGLGLGAAEEVLTVWALGRRLVAPSVLSTMGAVHLEPLAGDRDWLRVAGACTTARGVTVVQDEAADAILVRTADGAALYRNPARRLATIAGGPWIDTMADAAALGDPVARADAAALLRLRLIDAAALAGLADAALTMAADYSKLREQFGRPIGSFQAIKHHCANMAVAARTAIDLCTFAAVAIDEGRDEASFLVDSALVAAAGAATDNAAKNVQIHGGIGFSAEADVHLFPKRTQMLIALAGGVEAAVDRLGARAVASSAGSTG